MKLTKKSNFTGKEHTREIGLTEEQLNAYYMSTKPIQIIFPHLSVEDREFIMTGTTPEEWKELFGDD